MNNLAAFTLALPYLYVLDSRYYACLPPNVIAALRIVEREMTAANCDEGTMVSQWVAKRLGVAKTCD